jgi:hypothetical protein
VTTTTAATLWSILGPAAGFLGLWIAHSKMGDWPTWMRHRWIATTLCLICLAVYVLGCGMVCYWSLFAGARR